MGWFGLKLSLSKGKIGSGFVSSKRLSVVDKKIGRTIKRFEYDEDAVKKQRQESRSEILKLERAMKRTDKRDLKKQETMLMKDVRKYENSMRRQLLDVLKIINQLRKIVENEDLELIYDARNPLMIFEEFMHQLKKSLTGAKIEADNRKRIKTLK